MLLPIRQVLDKNQAADFLSRLQTGEWNDGRLTAGGQAALVKRNLQLRVDSDLAVELGNDIVRTLGSHPLFMSAALPRAIFPPRFNCYQHGGHYGLHVDSAIMSLPDNRQMRTDLSATLFLADADSYEGGELIVESQYGAQSIKLDAGDLILYPSTSLHEVRPVTTGARICAFFWIESLVRDCGQRELLFDLDQSIQQLTTELGADHSEVRRLSGVYHNLVRAWSLC